MLKIDMKTADFSKLSTEAVNPRSRSLDLLSSLQIVELMNREDRRVVQAVRSAGRAVARGISVIEARLRRGGRLVFAGAGTSGRLGVIEAAECPPTFNTEPSLVAALMAGGPEAVFQSKEGAEDSESAARAAVRRTVRRGDVMVGIAASGVTPFVRAALAAARKKGAATILVTCNPRSKDAPADVLIAVDTGPEVLTGSTRLKAGTACKMVLNMLSTASMVRLGKVYGNFMVDLQPKSKKLVARGLRLIERLGQVPSPRAAALFDEAGGRVKTAIVMARLGLGRRRANERLKKVQGSLRRALDGIKV